MGSIRFCNQKIAELGQCICNLCTLAGVFGRWLHGLFASSYTPGQHGLLTSSLEMLACRNFDGYLLALRPRVGSLECARIRRAKPTLRLTSQNIFPLTCPCWWSTEGRIHTRLPTVCWNSWAWRRKCLRQCTCLITHNSTYLWACTGRRMCMSRFFKTNKYMKPTIDDENNLSIRR